MCAYTKKRINILWFKIKVVSLQTKYVACHKKSSANVLLRTRKISSKIGREPREWTCKDSDWWAQVRETWDRDGNGKSVRKRLEVDFVVNHGPERVYIQSAFRMPTSEKESQEQRPLINTGDNFRKMIVVGDNIMRKVNERGIVTMSLLDFLLDPDSVSSLFGR